MAIVKPITRRCWGKKKRFHPYSDFKQRKNYTEQGENVKKRKETLFPAHCGNQAESKLNRCDKPLEAEIKMSLLSSFPSRKLAGKEMAAIK